MSEPSDDGGVRHRPLPSVGIPLLRDEVRASRVRRVVAGSLVGVALVAILLAVFVVPELVGEEEPVEEPDDTLASAETAPLSLLDAAAASAPPEVVEEPLADGAGTRTVRPFGSAIGFRPALVEAGCTGAEADALIAALTEVMDFRRCRPSHELIFERDVEGTLTRFEYRASSTQVYEAHRNADGDFEGSRVEVPIDRIRIARGGTIRASLGAALERAGLGRTLVGVFVETFERQINFNTQTRAGDTFRIIVEEERVAGELLRYGTVYAIEVRGQRFGEHRAYWYEARPQHGDFHDETGRAFHGGWLRTPLRYDHISSPFDPRRLHPILRRVVPHNGVDYAAGTGTPVWAAADGTVTFVGARGANGNLVSVQHENGYETHYAHLSRFAAGLERGQTVTQRQVIGYVGSTGRSTGPHLHFGLARHGRFVDPQVELNGPGRMLAANHLARFRRIARTLRAELDAIEVGPAPDDAAEEPEPPAAPTEPTD